MTPYLTILASVLPLFLLMFAGAAVRRKGILTEEADRTLLGLIVHLLWPCIILDHVIPSAALRQTGNLFWSPLLGFVCAGGGIALAFGAARLWGMKSAAQIRTFSFIAGICNYAYIPVPLMETFCGADAVSVLFLFNLGTETAFWIIGFSVLEDRPLFRDWRRALTSPVRAILLGVAINLGGAAFGIHFDAASLQAAAWGWPTEVLLGAIHLAGLCSIPLALLLIGATMADFWDEFDLRQGMGGMVISVIVRNFIGPLIFIVPIYLLPLSLELKETLIAQAAMPSSVFPLVLARHHGGDVPMALQVIFSTSAVALVTLPLWIHFGMQFIGVR